mmetsp:Transcript_23055/g.74438  ORF Transcript_23055/g.74438 Transcript_23055/m.74438 type:complete len:220 (-) Transcript_23055:1800-2459(-)
MMCDEYAPACAHAFTKSRGSVAQQWRHSSNRACSSLGVGLLLLLLLLELGRGGGGGSIGRLLVALVEEQNDFGAILGFRRLQRHRRGPRRRPRVLHTLVVQARPRSASTGTSSLPRERRGQGRLREHVGEVVPRAGGRPPMEDGRPQRVARRARRQCPIQGLAEVLHKAEFGQVDGGFKVHCNLASGPIRLRAIDVEHKYGWQTEILSTARAGSHLTAL